MLPWSAIETDSRNLPERGYDDPTAHCFPAGVPRSMYVPAAFHIIQTPEHIVFLHERMAWRIVPLDGRPHLPDTLRLWQGDSLGRWENDTLVIDTVGFTDSSWLHKNGWLHGYNMKVTERLTRTGNTLTWEATVEDPDYLVEPWKMTPMVATLNPDPNAFLAEGLPCQVREPFTSHVRSG